MTNFILNLIVISLGLSTVYGITFVSASIIGGVLSLLGSGVPVLEHALMFANYSTVIALVIVSAALLLGRIDIRTEDDE